MSMNPSRLQKRNYSALYIFALALNYVRARLCMCIWAKRDASLLAILPRTRSYSLLSSHPILISVCKLYRYMSDAREQTSLHFIYAAAHCCFESRALLYPTKLVYFFFIFGIFLLILFLFYIYEYVDVWYYFYAVAGLFSFFFRVKDCWFFSGGLLLF